MDTAGAADGGALGVADARFVVGPEGCCVVTGCCCCCDAAAAEGTAGGTYVGEPVDTDEAAGGAIPDSTSASVVSNVTPSVDTSVMPKMAQPMQQRLDPA